MENEFSRTELLIGKENVEKLKKKTVAIFGLGGVGSFVLEALVRSGIGNFILIDNDKIDITNINRQILATRETIGNPKVEVAKDRILKINPKANVKTYEIFFNQENREMLNKDIDYIADCIDTISSKIELVIRAKELNVPIISSMGTGNKLDPSKFEIADIYKTTVCPLAKIMRKELKKRNINSLKVVYSKEESIKIESKSNNKEKQSPGSISFVPSVAGLIIAGEIIKDLIK